MSWWMVLLGVVLLIPALLIVIALYIAWLIRALDAVNPDMRRTLSNGEWGFGMAYWLVHLVTLTATGWWLLMTGLGV